MKVSFIWLNGYFYHKNCSKCPPFARTHARRRPRTRQCRSGPCHAKRTANAASVRQSCAPKTDILAAGEIFNMNRKLKQ